MEPTSRGFSEVRDVFFRELVEISKNSLNGGGKEKLGDVSHVLHVRVFCLICWMIEFTFMLYVFGHQGAEEFYNKLTEIICTHGPIY